MLQSLSVFNRCSLISAARDAIIYDLPGAYAVALVYCAAGGVILLGAGLWVYLAAEAKAQRNGVLDRAAGLGQTDRSEKDLMTSYDICYSMSSYAHPEVLTDTQWVSQHLTDPNVRIVEVDYDPTSNYVQGHIPGAILFDWRNNLNDPLARDMMTKEQLEDLMGRGGIDDHTTVVLYGDFNNWFAAYAFWDLKYYNVDNVKLMDGGRKKWLLEDRPVTREVPTYPRKTFSVTKPDVRIRVYRDEVRRAIGNRGHVLVDVRSPKEFSGEITAPPEYPNEQAQRGGHIPGAKNIPWAQAVNDADGTFKPKAELEKLYSSAGVQRGAEVITYCRIGERSSHTWFVLKYLLGYPNVRNYDGSWTEWGNSIMYPIER